MPVTPRQIARSVSWISPRALTSVCGIDPRRESEALTAESYPALARAQDAALRLAVNGGLAQDAALRLAVNGGLAQDAAASCYARSTSRANHAGTVAVRDVTASCRAARRSGGVRST